MKNKRGQDLLFKFLKRNLGKNEALELDLLCSNDSQLKEQFELIKLLQIGIVKDEISKLNLQFDSKDRRIQFRELRDDPNRVKERRDKSDRIKKRLKTRILPVYFLIDTSGSMTGEPIDSIISGIKSLASELRQNKFALESMHLSVITFNSIARQIIPLTNLESFHMSGLLTEGSTSLGTALSIVSICIDKEVIPQKPDNRGDWKPIVVILTDGQPTDDWQTGLSEYKKREVGFTIACAIGPDANTEILKQITENVVILDTGNYRNLHAFFHWVVVSIEMASSKIESTDQKGSILQELPPFQMK